MTAEFPDGSLPATTVPAWLQCQSTLKSTPTPGYDPAEHAEALGIIGERLLADRTIASGKLGLALEVLALDPQMSRTYLSAEVFNGNSGYTLQVMWPLLAIFAGRMPMRVSESTAGSYIGWIDRMGRVVTPGLSPESAASVHRVLDAVSDAIRGAVTQAGVDSAVSAREAEEASDRVDTNEPGIYVFSTPMYLAYPPLGWGTDDPSRRDFRYLKTGSTSVDITGRIQSEIRRQTGLPEPYVIIARFVSPSADTDYLGIERAMHRLLGEARHGPEDDGTRRSSSRGAGTEWFITRLPFVIAVAESLGLSLSVSDDLKARVNEMFEDCELPDWQYP